MRRALDLLYRGSGALAASFLVAICVVVLAQVGGNIIDAVVKLVTGEAIGLVIPSYAEFTGYFLASASFLALAYTLRMGGHIRVSLVIQAITGPARKWIELWCVAAATAMSGYFAFFAIELVLNSFKFGDVSYGMIPVPLWIPQAGIAIGVVIVTIALVDEFFAILGGAEPSYARSPDALFSDDETDRPG